MGLGARKSYNRKAYRRALQAALQTLTRTGVKHAVVWLAHEPVPGVDPYYAGRFAAEAAANVLYRIPDLKTGVKPSPPALIRLTLVLADAVAAREAQRGLHDGAAIADGMKVTRDLANLPANVCTPRHLGRAARTLGKKYRPLKVKVLERRAIEKLRMGAFLSVTHGSDEPPQLIVLEYRGGRRSAAPIALIGKGITFDSGGISLKDPAGMDEMKFDMSGAASVLGTFASAAALRLPLNLVGIIPACENLPNGRATKPGDIVRSMSGQTVEVLNTDAEGRLILADALTYVRRFKPAAVVDVATLTGACVVALGAHFAGLMSADAELTKSWRAPVSAPTIARGACRWSRNMENSSRAISPTWRTRAAARAAPSRQRVFSRSSHKACAGRTWTSLGLPGSPGRRRAARAGRYRYWSIFSSIAPAKMLEPGGESL